MRSTRHLPLLALQYSRSRDWIYQADSDKWTLEQLKLTSHVLLVKYPLTERIEGLNVPISYQLDRHIQTPEQGQPARTPRHGHHSQTLWYREHVQNSQRGYPARTHWPGHPGQSHHNEMLKNRLIGVMIRAITLFRVKFYTDDTHFLPKFYTDDYYFFIEFYTDVNQFL